MVSLQPAEEYSKIRNFQGASKQPPGLIIPRPWVRFPPPAPDIDLRMGDHARVFVTLAFDEFSGKYPRSGIDRDIADGHEGFVEFGSNLHDPHPGWDVIVGRQEISLGTGRLLDNNEA